MLIGNVWVNLVAGAVFWGQNWRFWLRFWLGPSGGSVDPRFPRREWECGISIPSYPSCSKLPVISKIP